MAERPVVVISSTALDLPEHRREVMAACLSLDCVPKMMEHLPAVDADAIQASLALVDQADIYIGVFAYRYGYIPKDHEISITEMEYQRAQEKEIPQLIFLIHKNHLVTGEDFETGDSAEKLKALKTTLETERVVAYFSSPSDLRAKVLQSMVALREKLGAEASEGTEAGPSIGVELDRPPLSIENNPYRSLSAFKEEDAAVFYGRDVLIRETLATFYGLIDPRGAVQVRLLAILGPSGSGKSSFARAGLAARLNQKAGSDHQTELRVFTFFPGEHPMEALNQVIRSVFSGERKFLAQEVEDAGLNNRKDEPFPSPLMPLPAGSPDQLVLLVDQFEEIYSLCDDEPERNAFVNALVTAAAEPMGRVSVILTMRSDFLGETQRHSELNTAIAKHELIVPAMSAEDLRLAITEPAKRAGYSIGETTVGRLIDETIGREGVLPLLQFVLSAIWQGMASGVAPADTLNKLGGVGGALANHAEELYQTLTEQEQHIARRAFLGMIQLGEGAQDTRRRVPVANLVASDSEEHVLEVLNRFAEPQRRLVTLSAKATQPVAEVTHEALFSHWARLRQWINKNRDFLRWRQRLQAALSEWELTEKDVGTLLRGASLTEAKRWFCERSVDLTDTEVSFIHASISAHMASRRRERKRAWRSLAAKSALLFLTFFILGIYTNVLQNRPDLSVWHLAELDEEFTTESDVSDFTSYLALEERLFAQLDARVYAKVGTGSMHTINRFSRGSLSDSNRWPINWNRSFELRSDSPEVGVILLHGLSDSPYSLRTLGERLHDAGAWVVGLRIPGHGTAPSGLVETRWQDMAAAVRLAVRHVSEAVGEKPFYIVGYSTGGALAVEYVLSTLDDASLPRPTGIVLVSPAIGFSSLAALAVWQARLGHFLGLEKLAWSSIIPEYDPFKYRSFAINAGDLAYRLTEAIQKRLESMRRDESLEQMPPILAFQSLVDATVSTRALVENLFALLPPAGHELVLFDINRRVAVEELLMEDPATTFVPMLSIVDRGFDLTVITNENDESPRVIARTRMHGSKEIVEIALDQQWPKNAFSLTHVSLPISPQDPLYGGHSVVSGPGIKLGNMAVLGAVGSLRVPAYDIAHLRWNPFYNYLESRVLRFMRLPEEAVDSINSEHETRRDLDKSRL